MNKYFMMVIRMVPKLNGEENILWVCYKRMSDGSIHELDQSSNGVEGWIETTDPEAPAEHRFTFSLEEILSNEKTPRDLQLALMELDV